MTKVAIVGATGPTGFHLAAELRKTPAALRVVARSADKLARLFPDAEIEKRPATFPVVVAELTDGRLELTENDRGIAGERRARPLRRVRQQRLERGHESIAGR